MYNTCQTPVLRQEVPETSRDGGEIVFPWPFELIVGGVVGMWILKEVYRLIKAQFTHRTDVHLEVDSSGGPRGRKGKVLMRPHAVKWLWWQLVYYSTHRQGRFLQNGFKFFVQRHGFRYVLHFIARDFKGRCKCPVPRVSVPGWVSINGAYWIRDDVVSMRYSASCETCKGKVFVSRMDLVSMALTMGPQH